MQTNIQAHTNSDLNVKHQVIYLMGVSGCGKSTVGQALSRAFGISFYDGDDFHSQQNIQKMAAGIPLTDSDRKQWLDDIHEFACAKRKSESLIIACSALKEAYRNILSKGLSDNCCWIYLKGDYDTILSRMKKRDGHFMPSSLLSSQFESLEQPSDGIVINIDQAVDSIIEDIRTKINIMKAEFGIIGLGVMGKSISRNLATKGFKLALYNQHIEGKEEHVAQQLIQSHTELKQALGFDDLAQFVKALIPPRKVFLMVKAGEVVDQVIMKLKPLLSAGDVIIDGGNSHYKDTLRRAADLSTYQLEYIGAGVSGGEEGALKGPSIMPGGSRQTYEKVSKYFEAMAASDGLGGKCCTHIGRDGAGHFVKMVHNGIEYAEMQLIAEVYALLIKGAGMEQEAVADVFEEWLNTDSTSYLLEISTQILRKKEDGNYLLNQILDQAGNKGTGSWTTIAACELGVPIPTISAALFARYQSAFIQERQVAHKQYQQQYESVSVDLDALRKVFQLARIVNHHQGFHLIDVASKTYNWNVDLSELARIWTNGCIIRSTLMSRLIEWTKDTARIIQHPEVLAEFTSSKVLCHQVITKAFEANVPVPCFSSAVNYLNAYLEYQSSANMIQAQRDFFGAHTYKRVNDLEGKSYHTNWEVS